MSTTTDNPTGNAAADTTAGTVKTKTAKVPKQGLAADAAAAKAHYGAEDQRSADRHQKLRDEDKIVGHAPIRGYESVRENMYQTEGERVDTPQEPLEGGDPIDKDDQ